MEAEGEGHEGHEIQRLARKPLTQLLRERLSADFPEHEFAGRSTNELLAFVLEHIMGCDLAAPQDRSGCAKASGPDS